MNRLPWAQNGWIPVTGAFLTVVGIAENEPVVVGAGGVLVIVGMFTTKHTQKETPDNREEPDR